MRSVHVPVQVQVHVNVPLQVHVHVPVQVHVKGKKDGVRCRIAKRACACARPPAQSMADGSRVARAHRDRRPRGGRPRMHGVLGWLLRNQPHAEDALRSRTHHACSLQQADGLASALSLRHDEWTGNKGCVMNVRLPGAVHAWFQAIPSIARKQAWRRLASGLCVLARSMHCFLR